MVVPKRRVLFIDSALPEEVEKALQEGFQGVTTNPALVAEAKVENAALPLFDRYVDHMKKLSDLCKKYQLQDKTYPSLSVEAISLEPNEMIDQAEKLRSILDYPNLAIKVPVSFRTYDETGKIKEQNNYLGVIRHLSRSGFNVNATCAFSASQLELAAQSGARFVSLFYNRLIDYFKGIPNSDGDGQSQELALAELRKVRAYLDDNPGLDCEIILGSIRKPYDVTNGWKNGADIVTAGYKVVPGMMFHQATDSSVKDFDDKIKSWGKKK